jgi:hypothetical protein
MHRNDNLSGHRWGVARKRELPQHETAGGYPHWEWSGAQRGPPPPAQT